LPRSLPAAAGGRPRSWMRDGTTCRCSLVRSSRSLRHRLPIGNGARVSCSSI
jgi:hypothetical protein